MKAFRTPEERFRDLPGYPFEPHYVELAGELNGLRMHYVDEGRGEPVLLLHGEPDWSYLYRKMIPRLAESFRVIAPDYLGFGRSDKPEEVGWYTYDRHAASMHQLVDRLGLDGITVVVQDWGGPIGLRVAAEKPERFARLVVMDTGLFVPGEDWPTEGFVRWRSFAERLGTEIPVGMVMQRSCLHPLAREVVAAYEAPFPTSAAKAGVAAFPLLVPLREADPGAAEMERVRETIAAWDVPALVIWGDSDPVFPVAAAYAMARLLRRAGEPVLVHAGHMVQEDAGEEVADRILEWTGALPAV